MKNDKVLAQLQELDLGILLKLLRIEADKYYDGHYTIFSFTTEYKVVFYTPDLDTGKGRDQIREVKGYPNLKTAIVHALAQKQVGL